MLNFSEIIFHKPWLNEKRSAWIEHIPFAFYLVEKLKPSVIVELGTHYGNSYFALCQAVKTLKIPAKTFAVDNWSGDQHAGFYDEEVFKYVSQVNKMHFAGFSGLLKMKFDEALELFEDGSIDLLHIDGLHTYEAVKHDFYAWLPKVNSGGVVLLHDTQEKKKDFGVWKLKLELHEQFHCCEFTHGHGLGIVCAGNMTVPGILEFCEEFSQNPFIQELFATLGKITLQENTWYRQRPVFSTVSSRFARVLYSDEENEWVSNDRLVQNVTGSSCRFIFGFSGEERITRLRFIPLNQKTQVKLNQISFFVRDQEIHPPMTLSTNAIQVLSGTYLFESDEPCMDIEFSGGEYYCISQMVVEVIYLTENRDLMRLILKQKGYFSGDL